MRITKIEIANYKSIKEPVEINFYNGLPTVLIGKNGSGKTNILEALSAIAEANGNYFGLRKELSMSYKVHIRLEKEDAEKLFPGKSIGKVYTQLDTEVFSTDHSFYFGNEIKLKKR